MRTPNKWLKCDRGETSRTYKSRLEISQCAAQNASKRSDLRWKRFAGRMTRILESNRCVSLSFQQLIRQNENRDGDRGCHGQSVQVLCWRLSCCVALSYASKRRIQTNHANTGRRPEQKKLYAPVGSVQKASTATARCHCTTSTHF